MNYNKLKKFWLAEQEIAHIHGWDFSHIDGRWDCREDDLPWDYPEIIKEYLSSDKRILDIDTGGGEFLLTLGHPYNMTSATEAYPPNVKLCKNTLVPLGINFREAVDYANLPFEDDSFDIVINRHGAYDISELKRILKKGGVFITQQVGEENDRELVELLCPNTAPKFKGWNLQNQISGFEQHGFDILKRDEHFCPIEFYDVGALVWFARIIEWEFIGFSVEKNFEQLCNAYNLIQTHGKVEGHIHRFMITAQKI